jgi:ATP-binding protein involved in chromosome partitioning
VIVTIPTGVSQFVVGKSIRMARDVLRTPVIGLIENMASHVCARCGHEEALFPALDVEGMAAEEGVAYLGRVPFDARIAASGDDGVSFMTRHGPSPAGEATRRIARAIEDFLEDARGRTERPRRAAGGPAEKNPGGER